MWKLSAAAAAAIGGLILAPALASAQARGGEMGAPRHELGVDLTLMYTHVGSGCSTDCSFFRFMTPVDVRVGFLGSGPVSFEPRFTLNYVTGGGGHALQFAPGLNVLYHFGQRSGTHNLMGPYFTAGIAVDLIDVSGTAGSSTQASVNVGIGKRIAWESAAFRPEAFLRYNFENRSKGIAATFDLGARIGLSFFH